MSAEAHSCARKRLTDTTAHEQAETSTTQTNLGGRNVTAGRKHVEPKKRERTQQQRRQWLTVDRCSTTHAPSNPTHAKEANTTNDPNGSHASAHAPTGAFSQSGPSMTAVLPVVLSVTAIRTIPFSATCTIDALTHAGWQTWLLLQHQRRTLATNPSVCRRCPQSCCPPAGCPHQR